MVDLHFSLLQTWRLQYVRTGLLVSFCSRRLFLLNCLKFVQQSYSKIQVP